MEAVTLIAACDVNGCIGKDNKLPWKCKSEMEYFKERVASGPVIMGKNTCLSIKGRRFNNDTHYVLTSDKDFHMEGYITVNSMENMRIIMKESFEHEYFVLGGAQIYGQFMDLADEDDDLQIFIELSIMQVVVEDGDSFFPFEKIKVENGYVKTHLERKVSDDIQWGVQIFFKIR